MNWRISILCVLIASNLAAQRLVPAKVPLSYSWAINANPEADLCHIFVKGDFEKIAEYAQKHGGKLKYTFKSYAAICIDPDAVLEMNNLDFVDHVHFEYAPGQPLLSQSRIHTNVNQVHAGSDGLHIAADTAVAVSYAWYYNGTLIEDEHTEFLSSLALGLYQGSYTDSNGCEHLSNQINVHALGGDYPIDPSIVVFPNPMSDILEVQLNTANYIRYELLDAQGRIVMKNDITQPHIYIQTTSLSEGSYFLKLIGDNNNEVIPVIK
jgi:hypothetical protein